MSTRRVRYVVATSLDGYIAGPQGEFDWIVSDPEIDFAALFGQFDTFLMGRRTYEITREAGQEGASGARTYVFSRTLKQEDHPGVTVVAEGIEATLATLRSEKGKDIWLFGGGELFRSLLGAGLVDTVEVAVIPILLGGGIPLLPSPASRVRLELTDHRIYGTGIASLVYAIKREEAGP